MCVFKYSQSGVAEAGISVRNRRNARVSEPERNRQKYAPGTDRGRLDMR